MAFQAYGLKQYQMNGVYDDKDKYTVHAKIPHGASDDDIKLMLRNMLAERFKLTFDYESKELPGYVLVVAKSGLKIKETADPPVPAPSAPPGKDADGFATYPAMPGSFYLPRANGLIRMTAVAYPMDRLATSLTSLLQKPVFDETELKGKYDFTATFTQESVGQAAAGSEPAAGLTLFEALEKGLGLRLEKTRKPVDMFVIDHVDKSAAEN
jgi:uncharacterized protein (TIGR03435 family)